MAATSRGGKKTGRPRRLVRSCDDSGIAYRSFTSSTSSDTSDDEGNLSAGSYDSDDFTKSHSFQLTPQQTDKCLNALKCRIVGQARKTSTSYWSKKVSSSCAAYKLFKVKRWLLTNENLIFDPLLRHPITAYVQPGSLLWYHEDLQSNELQIKALSVDGLLCKMPNSLAKRQNLTRIDELMQDINWPSMPEKHEITRIFASAKSLPFGLIEPFCNLMFSFYNVLFNPTGMEMEFQDLFERLFRCIAACLGEDIMIQCRATMDGSQLDKLKLPLPSDKLDRHLLISSIPDLFIFERISVASKRGIAVVEVKGKKGDKVIHSDDEDEDSGSLASVDEESEESEEELSIVEKVKHKKHGDMAKLKKKMRRYVRKFLPQLMGEMLCLNETKGIVRMKEEEPGFSFGVAMVGFDVHFVSLVRSDGESIRYTFHQNEVFTHVFITRALDIRNRTDRRIVFKTLAAACYVQKPMLLPNDIPSGLEISSLRL